MALLLTTATIPWVVRVCFDGKPRLGLEEEHGSATATIAIREREHFEVKEPG
jgi:hypothetical protein